MSMRKTIYDVKLVSMLQDAFHMQGVNYTLNFTSAWDQREGYNKEWVLDVDEHEIVDALMEYFYNG